MDSELKDRIEVLECSSFVELFAGASLVCADKGAELYMKATGKFFAAVSHQDGSFGFWEVPRLLAADWADGKLNAADHAAIFGA